MERQDEGMAFLLQYENIAWFDKGKVRILDRRIYPEVKFVTCENHKEVAQAITDMVTQSCGPY
ncbi:MAG: S-methyl-5-thioribose-1-phosphate isomerase, partial [Firmicutes bacterium]|nr:S-methyl-5-thioribose-1-phosphate isomerase [Bacillota bacterium]